VRAVPHVGAGRLGSLPAAVLALLLGACSAGPGTARSTAIRNQGADRRIAESINLTPADLPGFQAGASTAGTSAAGRSLAHCAGAPDPASVDVVDLASPIFTVSEGNGQEQFSSDVAMVHTPPEAAADLRALGGSRIDGCLRSVIVPALSGALPAGASLGAPTVTRLRPVWAPAGSVMLHIVLPVSATASGATAGLSLEIDLLAFSVGRAQVALDGLTIGNADPSTQEARLTNVLYRRVRSVRQAA